MGEKTRVRIRSSSLQSAGIGGLDTHTSFFAHLSHLGPSGGDFKASRRNCINHRSLGDRDTDVVGLGIILFNWLCILRGDLAPTDCPPPPPPSTFILRGHSLQRPGSAVSSADCRYYDATEGGSGYMETCYTADTSSPLTIRAG